MAHIGPLSSSLDDLSQTPGSLSPWYPMKAYQLSLEFGQTCVQTPGLAHLPSGVTLGELFNVSEPHYL